MLASRLIWYMKDPLAFAGRVGLTCKRMHAALLAPAAPFWQFCWHQVLGMKARRTKTARKCVLAKRAKRLEKRAKRYEKRYRYLVEMVHLVTYPFEVANWLFCPKHPLRAYTRLEIQRAKIGVLAEKIAKMQAEVQRPEIGVLEAKIAKMQAKLHRMRKRQEEDEHIWRVMK